MTIFETVMRKAQLREAIHEVADLAVNFGGYADDATESDRRSVLRDEIEKAVSEVVVNALNTSEVNA